MWGHVCHSDCEGEECSRPDSHTEIKSLPEPEPELYPSVQGETKTLSVDPVEPIDEEAQASSSSSSSLQESVASSTQINKIGSQRLKMLDKGEPVDPAFRGISKTSTAFLIWRVENMQLVPVAKDHYGTFYEGDSYIVYAASEYGKHVGTSTKHRDIKGRLEIHIHFWLGRESSQDESAVAAFKTVELDDYLGGSPVQHREVMGNESPRFRAYFKQGLRILKGGVASGLNSVNNNVEPRLFRVKGRRCPVLTQMPSIDWKYFNSGDVFIIDTKEVVFIWVGRTANTWEKLQATKVAIQLRDEHNAVSLVFVDDGKEADLTQAEKVLLGVYLDLNPKARRIMPESPDDDSKVEVEERSALRLYKCSDADGTYKVTEVKTGPLTQSDLNINDSFIIDNFPYHVWVWVGKHASAKERMEAMRNAQGYVMKKNYPKNTQVSRIVDGGEPTEFKALFTHWKDKDAVTTIIRNNNVSHVGRIAQMLPGGKLDVEALHNAPAVAAKEQLVDDGSGRSTVWRIRNSQLVEVPTSSKGIFYSGDCYIVEYKFNEGGREHILLYYWLGAHSTVTEQTAAALLTIAQDENHGRKAVQVRVVQGKEPPHFLAMFHGKFIIAQGEHADSLSKQFLIQVRGNCAHNTRSTQVDFKASSLNSNDVFVLATVHVCYVWCGKGSTGDEREMAKQIATTTYGPEFSVVFEGQEKNDFWDCLGGKEPYSSSRRLQEEHASKAARLFQCSTASGVFKVEEITDFSQTDLVPDDVMLLDAIDAIFIWIGNSATREEKKKSKQFAFEYLRTDPSGRDPDTPILQVNQGFEPINFTGFFGAWDSTLWSNHKTYEDIRKELETLKPLLQVELKMANGVADFNECEKFPYYVLLEKDPEKLPPSVDMIHKELHLTADDFRKVFSMEYDDYSKLPKWRQEHLKKAAGLF